MFRPNKVAGYALLISALAFPQLSTAQGCESPKWRPPMKPSGLWTTATSRRNFAPA